MALVRPQESFHSCLKRNVYSPFSQTQSHSILTSSIPYFNNYRRKQGLDEDDQPDRAVGYGAFGVVWAVSDPRTGKRVALKKMPQVFQNYVSAKRAFRELKMLTCFKHDNIVPALDIIISPLEDEVYLLTELMQSDLHKIIVSPQPLTIDHVKVFLYQLLRGLKFLHSAGVLHRDIKPGNLLVNSNCYLKICDLGLARIETSDESAQLTLEVVTQYYRPPELLMGARRYTAAVDLWSVGCIMAELLSRKILFQAQTPLLQLDKMVEVLGSPAPDDMPTACVSARQHMLRSPPQPFNGVAIRRIVGSGSPHVTAEGEAACTELLLRLLAFNPEKRTSAGEALRHRFLEEGRVRFHSCMCVCCYTSPHQAARVFNPDLEPAAKFRLSPTLDNFRSTRKIKEAVCNLARSVNARHKFPVVINQASASYKNFAKSTVAQPAELPPSPHAWD